MAYTVHSFEAYYKCPSDTTRRINDLTRQWIKPNRMGKSSAVILTTNKAN